MLDPASRSSAGTTTHEEDHPERALCRAAFAADAEWVSRLLADDGLPAGAPLRDYERAPLLRAAGL